MITAALVGNGQLGHAVLNALAADSPILNTDGIVAAITKFVVPILLAALGVIFISRAGKGEMSKVMTSSAIAIVGLAFIAGAGALFLFGEKLVQLIFG
jgi:hypothetical protein